MGSPSYCYKEILKSFILKNNTFNKNYNQIKRDLENKSSEELTNEALKYYHNNKDYSLFLMGSCVSDFLNEYHEYTDMINASIGAISDIHDLFNIDMK